jgi:hypothetical protein
MAVLSAFWILGVIDLGRGQIETKGSLAPTPGSAKALTVLGMAKPVLGSL